MSLRCGFHGHNIISCSPCSRLACHGDGCTVYAPTPGLACLACPGRWHGSLCLSLGCAAGSGHNRVYTRRSMSRSHFEFTRSRRLLSLPLAARIALHARACIVCGTSPMTIFCPCSYFACFVATLYVRSQRSYPTQVMSFNKYVSSQLVLSQHVH